MNFKAEKFMVFFSYEPIPYQFYEDVGGGVRFAPKLLRKI